MSMIIDLRTARQKGLDDELERADAEIQASLDVREDKIHGVLNACIHTVGYAIRELGLAQDRYESALNVWGDIHDEIKARTATQ